MKIKQAKLAQALRGEVSNILTDKHYDMTFDKGMLHVIKKHNPNNIGPFIVFPANLAYIEPGEEIGAKEAVELPTEDAKAKRSSKK